MLGRCHRGASGERPALSQRSLHQAMVTRSPHQRCAISCATVSATKKFLHAAAASAMAPPSSMKPIRP